MNSDDRALDPSGEDTSAATERLLRDKQRALVAEVERLRGICAALFEELAVKDQAIEDIRALHVADPADPDWCAEDGFSWPCKTARLLADLSARLDQDKGDSDE